MHPGEVWESDSAKARLIRGALSPLSVLYALGWEAYLGLYRTGIKRAAEPHYPIVCIGNLVSGGSGKSPLTMHVADVLRQMGRQVVISCSGYGAPHAEAAEIAPEGPLSAREWGDEPAMIRWQLPDVPLVVGRRRVLAAQLVQQSFPSAVMLMDDGFQHLPLKKHLAIVLDDPRPKNKWCLPAGPYREGRWNRRRADEVLPGRYQIAADPLIFARPDGSNVLPQEIPDFTLLCALGQPNRFVQSVTAELGRPPRQTELLPDHDRLDAGTLLGKLSPDWPVVVTSKDWVKLRERPDLNERNWLIAKHRVRVEPEGEFQQWLAKRLDG